MYLKGYEDSGDEIALSANSAILLPETGRCGLCRAASSAWRASVNFITEFENQMRNLGISSLVQPDLCRRNGRNKAMDRK